MVALGCACDDESARAPARDEATAAAVTSESNVEGEASAQPAAPGEPPEPIDLLRAVPTAVAVSTAHRASPAQAPRLVDGDLATAWNSETGQHEGAWIDVRVPPDATVTAIQMTAGFTHETERTDLFTGNHRVSRVRVVHAGETVAEQELDIESRALQTIAIEGGGGGDYRIELADLEPGTREDWREASVSELRVMGTAPDARPGRYAPRVSIGSLSELARAGEGGEAPAEAAPGGPSDAVYLTLPDATVLEMTDSGALERVERRARVSVANDGTAWMVTQAGSLRRLPDGAPRELPAGVSASRGMPAALAPLPDGRVFVLGGGAASLFDGTSWSTVTGIGPDLEDIAVDADGSPWIAAHAHVYRRRGEAFEEVPVPHGAVGMWRFVPGRSAHLVIQHRRGLIAFDGRAFAPVDLSPPGLEVEAVDGTTIALDGTIVASHGTSSSLIVARPDEPPRRIDLDALEGRPQSAQALSFDGAGRLWMFANTGLYVLEPDLTTLARRYPPGTLEGIDEWALWTMTVAGTGAPPLPPARRAPWHATGRIVRDGQPLANTEFELCTRPLRGVGSMGSPCESVAMGEHKAFGRTRADGTFDLFGPPPDELMDFAIPLGGGRWFVTDNAPCCFMDRGRTLDIGTIQVTGGRAYRRNRE